MMFGQTFVILAVLAAMHFTTMNRAPLISLC
jgi:hypothetical protein